MTGSVGTSSINRMGDPFETRSAKNPSLRILKREDLQLELSSEPSFNIISRDYLTMETEKRVNNYLEFSKKKQDLLSACNYLSPRSGAVLLSPITVSTLTSPQATEVYNYDSIGQGREHFLRMKIVEELISSERNYVESLQVFLDNYIEPLIELEKYNFRVEFKMIHCYLEILFCNHCQLLKYMEDLLFWHNTILSPIDNAQHDKTCSDFQSIIDFSKLISERALSPYIYEQYSVLASKAIETLTSTNTQYKNFEIVKKAGEFFTGSVQGSQQNLDLSFISLFQKPVARISKYKLILGSLLSHISKDDKDELQAYEIVHDNLEKYMAKLESVNRNIRKIEKAESKYTQLFEALGNSTKTQKILRDRLNADLNYKFDFSSFGTPVLTGTPLVTTVEDSGKRCINSEYCICVLFKSTILFLSKTSTGQRLDIKLMILLSSALLYYDFEGIICSNEFSFKLIFENDFRLYEVLLVFKDNEDKRLWETTLDLLINHVNGPYLFDYSLSREINLGYAPKELIPFDICLAGSTEGRLSSFRNHFDNCYFRELIFINISFSGKQSEIKLANDIGEILTSTMKRHARDQCEKLLSKLVNYDEKQNAEQNSSTLNSSHNLEPLSLKRRSGFIKKVYQAYESVRNKL